MGSEKQHEAAHRPQDGKGLRSASVGAEQTSPGRLAPPKGAKALLIERSLSKVLLRYFRESNKAEAKKLRFAPYSAQ